MATAEKSRFANPAITMVGSFELAEKHYEILEPLTSKVRVMTYAQIARTFFAGSRNKVQVAEATISELEEAGFLKCYAAMVHPEIELKAPLCRYRPGDPDPDFSLIARETRGRWTIAPATTKIVYATKRASRIFGGGVGGKKPRPSETCHDIHVAQLFLRLSRFDPAIGSAWVPEERLRVEQGQNGSGIPDAEIRSDQPYLLEFGGSYPRKKLEAFHAEQKRHSYEIW